MKSRLQDIERTMGEVEDQLRRLRMYDQQLQDLRREGFSGYGPVEDDEADPSLFVDEEDAVAELDVDPLTGEFGEPMHALDGLGAGLHGPCRYMVKGPFEANALSLAQAIEPQIGLMVESAELAAAPTRSGPQRRRVRRLSTVPFGRI